MINKKDHFGWSFLMEPRRGIEPPTSDLRNRCSTVELPRHFIPFSVNRFTLSNRSERVTGIEPVSHPWEGYVEPLNYTRKFL